MTPESEQAVLEAIAFDVADTNEDILEQTLENILTENMEDLSALQEKLQSINDLDNLGQTIANVVWDQFTNQVAISIGEDFIRENRNLTLDLRSRSHIQTTENFSQGILATHNTEIDYQERYKSWQSNFEHNPDGSVIMHKNRLGVEEATLKKEARKPFDKGRPKGTKKNHTNMDHVKSAATIIRDPAANAHLTRQEQIAFANSRENLHEMDSSHNQSKGDLGMSDWLDTPNSRGQKPGETFDIPPALDSQYREAENTSNAVYNKIVSDGETHSIESGKKSQRQEFYRIGKHALRAAFMGLLAALAKEIISNLILWLRSTEKDLKTFISYVKRSIYHFVKNLRKLLIDVTDSVLTTVATAIAGPVIGIIKKTFTMLKQGWQSLKEAIEYLRKPENKGKPMMELLPQVGIIVVTGLSGVGAVALGEFIESSLLPIPFLAVEVPLLGCPASLIGSLMGAVVCGVIGAIAINLISSHVAEQQYQAVLTAQIEKENKILGLQSQLLGCKSAKSIAATQKTTASIIERHAAAATQIARIAESVSVSSEIERQKRCSNDLGRLLQGC